MLNRVALLCSFAFALTFVIACDNHGLDPPSRIAGKITYKGTWPDTTEWVRLAVFKELPATVLDIPLNPPLFSDTLPRFVSSYDYQIEAPPGTYEWVVLAWKPVKALSSSDFSGLDTLGMYALPSTPNQPLPVTVPQDGIVTGVNIEADFARLVPVSPILP